MMEKIQTTSSTDRTPAISIDHREHKIEAEIPVLSVAFRVYRSEMFFSPPFGSNQTETLFTKLMMVVVVARNSILRSIIYIPSEQHSAAPSNSNGTERIKKRPNRVAFSVPKAAAGEIKERKNRVQSGIKSRKIQLMDSRKKN